LSSSSFWSEAKKCPAKRFVRKQIYSLSFLRVNPDQPLEKIPPCPSAP
jgi:hypothetical protein